MSGGCGGVSLAPGGPGGEYGFCPSVLLPARSSGGAGCAGSGRSRPGGGCGSQLSSSGTGAVEGLLLLSSASPAGRSRAGLGLECRCLRMKGKTLPVERGQNRRGPPQVDPRGRPCPHRFLVSGGMTASARRFL